MAYNIEAKHALKNRHQARFRQLQTFSRCKRKIDKNSLNNNYEYEKPDPPRYALTLFCNRSPYTHSIKAIA
jgi:hypothetical protein